MKPCLVQPRMLCVVGSIMLCPANGTCSWAHEWTTVSMQCSLPLWGFWGSYSVAQWSPVDNGRYGSLFSLPSVIGWCLLLQWSFWSSSTTYMVIWDLQKVSLPTKFEDGHSYGCGLGWGFMLLWCQLHPPVHLCQDTSPVMQHFQPLYMSGSSGEGRWHHLHGVSWQVWESGIKHHFLDCPLGNSLNSVPLQSHVISNDRGKWDQYLSQFPLRVDTFTRLSGSVCSYVSLS